MCQSHSDTTEVDLLPRSCRLNLLCGSQDENIIQMSGGFRYYEGGHGSRMDGWMDGLNYCLWPTAHITAYSRSSLNHRTSQAGSVCFFNYCEIDCRCYLIMIFFGCFWTKLSDSFNVILI